MNQVHRYINFPKKLFNDPISDLEKLIHNYEMKFNKFEMGHFRFPLSEISEKYYSWFHAEFPNIFIKDWEVFYTPPGGKLPIHSDGIQPFIDFIKFNYVYDGEKSLMSWYELKQDIQLDSDQTGINTSYTPINENQVNLIYKSNMEKPSLINAGKPHGMSNIENDKGRWCVCLIPCYKNKINNGTSRIEFNDALSIFSKYIES